MGKRRTKADQERIIKEVERYARNMALPDVPDSEKIKKRFACGHDQSTHPEYQPGPEEKCKECFKPLGQIGSSWWGKMPPR